MTEKTIPAGAQEINGAVYMTDAKGSLVPIGAIRAQDLLMDETVRKMLGHAFELAAALAAFKLSCFEEIRAFNDLLDQEYGSKRGGPKGNVTLMTVDGLKKVTVQVADNIVFGPELQVAKRLIDECLIEWAAGGREELRAIVMRAFNVDRENQINRAELFGLLRLEIDDERWQRAMQAIRDSMRTVGTKEYVRFHTRPTAEGDWVAVSLNISTL